MNRSPARAQSTRAARTVRGLVAALVSVFVAAFSHVVGGGPAPGSVGVVLALAFSAMICVGLTGRALSLPRLALSVGFSQLALHLLFEVGAASPTGDAGAAGMHAAAASAGMAGMGHGAGSALLAALLAPGSSGGSAAQAQTQAFAQAGQAMAWPFAGHDMAWMWGAHALAALVTIVALRRGESAFWALLEAAAVCVLRLVQVPGVLHSASDALNAPVRAAEPAHPPLSHLARCTLSHRGPPLLSFS